MRKEAKSFGDLLRDDINSVNGFAPNAIDTFEKNVGNSLDNWLEWNPSVDRTDEAIQGIREASTALAGYLRHSGPIFNKDKVEQLKAGALDAVSAFETRYPEH